MDLSVALIIAASFCDIMYILYREKNTYHRFFEYSSKNSKKPNWKDCL